MCDVMAAMSFRSIPRGAYTVTRQKSRRICAPVIPARHSVMDVDGLQVYVTHKNNRNMYVRVKPPYGQVEVTAPLRVSERTIADFIRERMDWIESSQRKLKQARETLPQGKGFTWNTELEQKARESLNRQLPALRSHWEEVIGRSPTQITLRVMTSRWGSCTPSTGRIRLNLQLGLMDPKFLEYVLVHEMTHLWESGHGEKFQQRMDLYLPKWKQLRKEINMQPVMKKV